MHPIVGVVTATAVVVGAIATALYMAFNESPQRQNYNYHGNQRTTNNYNINTINTHHYPPSSENRSGNRRRQRRRATAKNDRCSICLENLVGEIEILDCEHGMHVKCLEDYSRSQRGSIGGIRCPLCRQAIN